MFTLPTAYTLCYRPGMRRKSCLLLLLLGTVSLHAQNAPMGDPNEGIWEGYEGESRYVSRLLLSLAEAIPAEKYTWRPAPGVRSVSEVYMHIAIANFYLLSPTGPKMPPELTSPGIEQKVTSKAAVIQYLKQSIDSVKAAHSQLKPGDLQRKVDIEGHTVQVDGLYLRIICHENEHLGQLIAYARVNGIVPPWSAASVATERK